MAKKSLTVAVKIRAFKLFEAEGAFTRTTEDDSSCGRDPKAVSLPQSPIDTIDMETGRTVQGHEQKKITG